jgi:aldehyde:ferredoxin oxidoreductase
MNGWMGKILRVNLSNGEINAETLDPQIARDFVGGRGLAIYFMLKEVDPKCDALGKENKLIMTTGPLTGTKAPTGGRYMVTTLSPLTNAITCANSGGHFPTELKRSGYDAIIVEGAATEPVYLWIDDGKAELKAAGHLWGKDTHETDDAIRAETDNKAKTAVIGPAGEKLVLFASIMNDRDRAAGRAGVGAVMGAKKLKGVAVRGTKKIAMANEEQFNELNKEYRGRLKEVKKAGPYPLTTHGTAITVVATQTHGVFPTRNFQTGQFEEWEAIYGEALTEKYLVKAKPCFSCPIACGRVTKVPDGPYQGEGEGPEYETVYSLGSDVGVGDLAALTKANYVCNELGLDTISMGSAIACAMELYEKGHLTESDIGFPLEWGDGEALIKLARQTGMREGFGDILAEGSLRMATRYGHPEFAMVSKGLDLPGYDPRGTQGLGLNYATSPIGASHMRGDLPYCELLGVPVKIDGLTWADKPPIVVKWQNVFSLIDAAGLCVFFSIRYLCEPTLEIRPDGIMNLLNAATGADYALDELEKIGDRILNAERLFLMRAGFDRRQDSLPDRFTQTPMPDGPAKGVVCHLDEMLEQYYQIRGWSQDGLPTGEKLSDLGLDGM